VNSFLQVRNLTIKGKRDGRILVDNLSLTLDKGHRLAIVGESGSGKTMTSMAIMNLLPKGVSKLSGEIIINGQDTADWSPERWRKMRNTEIAMVLQNPMSAFDPVLSIRRHFLETMRAHGLADDSLRKTALPALQEAGFPEPELIIDLYPFQMSGGMLQRVMVALALISRPSLIIADEATTDLDVVSQAQVLKLIGERSRERGMGILLITHDLSVAASLAESVLVMKHGRTVESGSLQKVFESPANPYTAGLLKAHHELYTPRFTRFMNCLEDLA